jgi:hypothetical protein
MERTFVRVAKVAAGLTILPVGVALLVLPGPGIPLVVGGLMLLEGEFGWAGRARSRLNTWAERGAEWLQRKPSDSSATGQTEQGAHAIVAQTQTAPDQHADVDREQDVTEQRIADAHVRGDRAAEVTGQ